MIFQKVSELQQVYLEVIITDYVSKKQYFDDSEVSGWLILLDKKRTKLFHLYRRGFDESSEKEINEPLINLNEELKGKMREKEIRTMLEEAAIQFRTEEDRQLLGKIHFLLGRTA